MDDLISRKAAIDAILSVTGNSSVRELYEHVQEHGLSDMWSGGVNAAIDIIIAVPSAQPEKRTEERTKTHSCDCISRQAAIEALKEAFNPSITNFVKAKLAIDNLPSAQPDMSEYSDKLWKAAYERGKAEAQQRWIPCSEWLPEEYGEYRITWVTSLVPSKRFIGDSEYEVTSVWDEERKGFKGEWLLDDYIKNYPDVKVIAWKPLEEPYREEGD